MHYGLSPEAVTAALERVRAICLGLPEVEERLSHGAPTWFVRGRRAFATFSDNHHEDGRLALLCAALPEMQLAYIEHDRDRFYRPPYVGHRGWVGVRLDRDLAWNVIEDVIHDAYHHVDVKTPRPRSHFTDARWPGRR